STGLKSPIPGPEMPYSVSMPVTFGIAIGPRASADARTLRGLYPPRRLEILSRADPVDLAALALGVPEQGPDVHDALALLARDPGPVVGVGRVGQVLVLLELVADGRHQVLELEALLAEGQEPLDGHLLGPADDVLDHGPGVEVLEVEDLLVPGLIRHFEE